MPPKKKGKGKKGPVLIDGVDTSAMTRDQLEAFALRLKAEMEREREERNFFQLERDKIRTFWEITRQQLVETRTELREKDHAVELTQEMADMESKHMTQRMKHLQYENTTKIGQIRAEAMTQLQMAQEDHTLEEYELLKDKRYLQRKVLELYELHDAQMQQMNLKNSQDVIESRMLFDKEEKNRTKLHDQKMQVQRDQLKLICRLQMFEVEERKNAQIKRLTDSHDFAFSEMKNYYNDITLNNLGLISSLKEQMELIRKQAERSERVASETMIENRRIKEPLELAQQEVQDLRRKLEHFERDRSQLARYKARNLHIEKKLKALTWETEALLLRNETLVREREELKAQFQDVVTELQQKTGLKNIMLERKIDHLERVNEKREVLLHESLAQCTATGTNPKKLEKRVDKIVDSKNDLITELRYELARALKAHDDMLDVYEAKLVQMGIPKEDLGYEPLRNSAKLTYLCGPAGLVTKNK